MPINELRSRLKAQGSRLNEKTFGPQLSAISLQPSAFSLQLNGSCRCRGQALVEFAIVGSVFLLALTFMIQIGLRANYQQEIDQQTFRRALRAAQQEGEIESAHITYHHFRGRKIPRPTDSIPATPRAMTESNAVVTWGEYLTFMDAQSRSSQGRIIVHLDDLHAGGNAIELRSEDLTPNQPLVSHISKGMGADGVIQQTQGSSTLSSTTGGTTTLTLNSSGASSVSSTMSTSVNYNW